MRSIILRSKSGIFMYINVQCGDTANNNVISLSLPAGGNQTYCGNHIIMYRHVKSLCCAPGSEIGNEGRTEARKGRRAEGRNEESGIFILVTHSLQCLLDFLIFFPFNLDSIQLKNMSITHQCAQLSMSISLVTFAYLYWFNITQPLYSALQCLIYCSLSLHH